MNARNTSAAELNDRVATKADAAIDNARHVANQAMTAVKTGVATARDQVARANVATRQYVRKEPVKSVLIAAAAGAAVAGLAAWWSKSHRDH